MAGMLKYAAAMSVNKGHPSVFYGGDKNNPVLQALEHEIKSYVSYMKKRAAAGGTKLFDEESCSRHADTLFELWNKYEPKLPKLIYQRKLLEVGDFLVSIKEYNLALWQCYGRYLKTSADVYVEEITDANTFQKTFFPGGFDADDANLTFRALMGKSICSYQVTRMLDPKLENTESIEKCLAQLDFLRLVTQIILPKESLCWLVYNGTVHIYSISRFLMSLGHSTKVLEYVLWASMCMESSIPLLAVKYLPWRTTLYTAVCQCYYDCKAGQHAEGFARRALSKINELSQLESMSNSSDNKHTEIAFRYATVKMAIMVYKRTVFETRRKPRGILRPKTRANLKDAAALPWPRTPSEKLLVEMFEGSSAQALCIVETLTDSNRRTLISSQPAPDGEVEILDVYAELFMAIQEIIAGGGGNTSSSASQKSGIDRNPMAGLVKETSLMELAARGEDGIPLSAVVKIVKMAYCYEQWDVLDSLLSNTLSALKEADDLCYGSDIKCLELLQAYDKAVPRTKHRKLFQATEEEEDFNPQEPGTNLPASQGTAKTGLTDDQLIQLADVLMSTANGPYSPDQLDVDMVIDACLFLWNKCKSVFQRFQTGTTDNHKYLQKMENSSKWVYILDVVHQVLGWSGLSSVDPALTAEVVLRLALVYEASAFLETAKENKRSANSKDTGTESLNRSKTFEDDQSVVSSFKAGRNSALSVDSARDVGQPMASQMSLFSQNVLSRGIREQLLQARDVLESGLENIAYAREAVARTDGKSIADITWAKEFNKDLFAPVAQCDDNVTTVSEPDGDKDTICLSEDKESIWNMVKDLNVEVFFTYHRICVKLAELGPVKPDKSETKPFVRKTCSKIMRGSTRLVENYIETFDELLQNTHKHSLSRSLLLMHKALAKGTGNKPTIEQKKLLQDAEMMIRKLESEEKKLYAENTLLLEETKNNTVNVKKTKVPPPPLLLCRTDNIAVFKPAEFHPMSGEKVAWYRIFARNAAGSNAKVRLNDYYLPGTGEEVPAFHCELRVTGLIPGEKYIYAVAAYTDQGKLIGNSIGESTRPILASHPLSVLMSWAYLGQVAYQVGHYSVAKEACNVLWNHFVAKPPPPEETTYISTVQSDFRLTLHRLNQRVVSQSSPVLLHMFLTNIFIYVDIPIKEGQLFCDKLCDKGPLNKGQISRLLLCERMLVAIELAGWLNEANLALQAVVQCYGLLAPLLHFQLPSLPVIQILERCYAILQEIPVSLRQKRSTAISESLHHMTACLAYYLAKVLRAWGQRTLANNINDTARKLLAQETDKAVTSDAEAVETTDTGSLTLAALKKKKTKKSGQQLGKDEPDLTGNEELKALEAHIFRLSKQGQGDHELTGNEDPNILHAYIAYLPSRIAQKEVAKFKRRARYLEFFIRVAEKALAEGIPEVCAEWCEDTALWLIKRNEAIIGSKATIGKQPGATTIIGDDPKKFAAALVEYSKKPLPVSLEEPAAEFVESDRENIDITTEATPKGKEKEKDPKTKTQSKPKTRKLKYKAIGITSSMTDAQKQQQEELEVKALEILKMYFIDMYQTSQKRKKIRRISTAEMPWRAQFNIVYGLAEFDKFLQKLDNREKQSTVSFSYLYSTTNLDDEWFALETAGTLVVGWTGGPSRQYTRQGERRQADYFRNKDTRAAGIEMAAAAATGKNPPPVYPQPNDKEEDTPRTYRSEAEMARKHSPAKSNRSKKGREDDPESLLISPQQALEMIKTSFQLLKRAIVLSHRGQHWTLLQNSCRALWNCIHIALMRGHAPTKTGESFISVKGLRSIAWEPLYTAADCLLDMLIQLNSEQDKPAKGKKESKTDSANKEKVSIKSCMGDITKEKGGADLKFEDPLDDATNIDTRWVRRLVLRTLELLYYEQKWERLVHVALRFNALSDDRYAEQVNPLLIQAQRKLINRIEDYGGQLPPQPHFMSLMENGTKPITAKQYATLQLQVDINKDNMSEISPGAQIDPAGHDAYGGGIRALRLSCVPVDVEYSLKNLREVLEKSNYSARALQHSRRLLILYLSGQTNSDQALLGTSPGHVDFVPHTAKPQPNMPPDISNELFLSMDDVQTSPLPRSQLNVVMTSYDKTIEMLMAAGHKALASEAMRELGNLHYHTSNVRGAYKWWAESLDMLLSMSDTIHNWRSLINSNQEDISKILLDRCGLWGCVLGGILSSNIAQYVLNSDLGLRTECCFLSGYFFKALFRSSLPHPMADCDYALYEVGEGCEVSQLIPGIDLLSERFRCDGRTLVAALRFILDELIRGKQHLFVLPLLTLYIHFTTFTCRDLQRAVEGRILKLNVLTDLCLFTEAFVILQQLLYGDRLPHSAGNSFRQIEGKMITARFNTSKPLIDMTNLKVMEVCVDKRLSASLSDLYGPHLTCQLAIAQAHLMIRLAETIPGLPKFEDIMPPGTSSIVHPPTTEGRDKDKRKPVSPTKPYAPKSNIDTTEGQSMSEEEYSVIATSHKRFTDTSKPVTLESIKGILLTAADQMLATLSEIVLENAQYDKGVSGMNASELELVVQCKLEMAVIADQRHHAAMAARLVLTTLALLQGADVFKQKQEQSPTRVFSSLRKDQSQREASPQRNVDLDIKQQYQYQDFQSRLRLDARLWLSTYLALVKSMTGEVRGLGQVKGAESSVKLELADVRQYCAEGIRVAEACGNVEIQAEFMLEAVILNIMDGRPVADTKILLQDIVKTFSSVNQLSPPAQLLLARAMTHHIDLDMIVPDPELDAVTLLKDTLNRYITVHDMILKQLEQVGLEIEYRYDGRHEYATLNSPISNLYQPHLLLLLQLKLRIGYTQARIVVKTVKQRPMEEAAIKWAEPLGVLTTALEMNKVIAHRVPAVEAELLLNIGKIQRQLFHLGKIHCRVVADTLLEAIRTSYNNDHDLSLMRQAYLEIAIVYLASSGQIVMKENSVLEPVVTEDEDDLSVASKDSVKKKKKSQDADSAGKRRLQKALPEDDKDYERRAAWIAVRCATALANARKARIQLSGQSRISSQMLGDKTKADLPEYLALDLVGSYVLGEKKRIYKNEIEEELAPLTEALEPPPTDTYDDQLNTTKQAATELSWIHVLGYQAILQRLCSTATMTCISKNSSQDDNTVITDILDSSEFDIQTNQDIVRSVIFATPWQTRLSDLHTFLVNHLPQYASDCCAIYPPSGLMLPIPSNAQPIGVDIVYKSYVGECTVVDTVPEVRSATTRSSVSHQGEQKITNPSDSELCLQWYQPTMDEHILTIQPEEREEAEQPLKKDRQAMLLYAQFNKKTERQSCRMLWVSLSQLVELHDRLCVLTQRGEISLTDTKPAPLKSELSSGSSVSKGKKQTRIKALSPKMKKDELLEVMIRECLTEACRLIGCEIASQDSASTSTTSLSSSSALLRQCMLDAQSLVNYTPETEELPESTSLSAVPSTPLTTADTSSLAATAAIPATAGPAEDDQPKEQLIESKPVTRESKEKSVLTDKSQKSEIPFDVNKANLYSFERLYDPSLGSSLRDAKMLRWFRRLFP